MSNGIKKSTKVIVGLIVLAVIAGVFVYRAITLQPEAAPLSIQDVQKRDGIPVDVAKIELRDVISTRELTGSIEGLGQVDINASMSMRVKTLHVAQGDAVRAGQLLVTLDPLSSPSIYSSLQGARVQNDEAQRNLTRLRPLFEAGAISQSDWERANDAASAAGAGLTDLEHAVRLRSPIAGTVTNIYLKPGDFSDPGLVIMSVSTTQKLKLVADISQREIAGVQVGAPAVITPADQAGAAAPITGRVSRVGLAADPKTRLFRVEIELDNGSAELRGGTLQRAVLTLERRDGVPAIPRRALVERDGVQRVFVVRDGQAQAVDLELGLSTPELCEIKSGLQVGDLVVVSGMNMLSLDSAIKVKIHNPAEVGLPTAETPSED